MGERDLPLIVCTRCSKTKRSSSFHKNPKAKSGHDTRCKTCVNAAKKSKRRQLRKRRQEMREFTFVYNWMPDERLVALKLMPFIENLILKAEGPYTGE